VTYFEMMEAVRTARNNWTIACDNSREAFQAWRDADNTNSPNADKKYRVWREYCDAEEKAYLHVRSLLNQEVTP